MYNFDERKSEGNQTLESYRYKWEDNIKGGLKDRIPVH
jgi:hypothetical protein